jgi:hypothetical protein
VYIRGDSVKDGALKGAVFGIGPGIFGCQGSSSPCSIESSLVLSMGMWSALGAWIDSRHIHRTVVYRAP